MVNNYLDINKHTWERYIMIILVLDNQPHHWTTLGDVYRIKTGWADGEFNPMRFKREDI